MAGPAMGKIRLSEPSLAMTAARFARMSVDPAPRERRTTSDYIVDALRAERPYRPGLPPTEVVDMLRADRGRALSADCVDAAVDVMQQA